MGLLNRFLAASTVVALSMSGLVSSAAGVVVRPEGEKARAKIDKDRTDAKGKADESEKGLKGREDFGTKVKADLKKAQSDTAQLLKLTFVSANDLITTRREKTSDKFAEVVRLGMAGELAGRLETSHKKDQTNDKTTMPKDKFEKFVADFASRVESQLQGRGNHKGKTIEQLWDESFRDQSGKDPKDLYECLGI